MSAEKLFDAVIIGGSYAGLAAAMTLARSLRHVLVIDSGDPCNKTSPHSHNFLTRDGQAPSEISQIARDQVALYDTVEFFSGCASTAIKTDTGFEVGTDTGKRFFGRKLVIACGVKDVLPPIEGFAPCWGITVIHCPYCHGYEFRGQPTGFLANGDKPWHAHLVGMIRNLTPQLTLFTNGPTSYTNEQLALFARQGIPVIETPVTAILHNDGQVNSVQFNDGSTFPLTALYASVPFELPTSIPQSLGCTLNPMGFVTVDAAQKTSVSGVFACGDGTTPFRMVAIAVSSGAMAGAMINKELMEEVFH
eukprot:TRINITY_DN15064_c0_g1_i1.p1 TRINITY_DN15064_c0_g1~~TRINITY_DN15064_c0_g1_i1.p1  ORF type:complete len:306 (-),score=50.03 TRINITY_DN15064_c0_g1_i1:112-1029(-)